MAVYVINERNYGSFVTYILLHQSYAFKGYVDIAQMVPILKEML